MAIGCEFPGCIVDHSRVSTLDELEPRRAGFPPERTSEVAQPVAAPAPAVPRHFRETVGPKGVQVFGVAAEPLAPLALAPEVPGLYAKPVGLAGDAATRKASPIASGVLFYFPNALATVAALSKVGNDQHNPGQEMHWAFDKSTDEADCIMRHLAQIGTIDTDGVRHAAKVAWRALALLERELLAAHPELQPGKNVRGFVR